MHAGMPVEAAEEDRVQVARAPRVDAPPKILDGSWQGNRTLWRTILDLNRILFFVDREERCRLK